MDLVKMKLADLVPYENNPRINDYAIEPVEQSIEQVGYITPIVIDENNVILAGHTRFAALEELGIDEVECVVVRGLSDDQKRKFRILDNKTAELAEWDNELLLGELEGIDLGDIHWFDDIINPDIEALSGSSGSGSKSSGSGDDEEDDGVVICPRCGAVVSAGTLPFGLDEEEMMSWSDEEE